jgi:hypothetical protein
MLWSYMYVGLANSSARVQRLYVSYTNTFRHSV